MAGLIELILFVGICMVVLGLGPGMPAQPNQRGGTYLDVLADVNKNSSEKVLLRVDSAARRSTCI